MPGRARGRGANRGIGFALALRTSATVLVLAGCSGAVGRPTLFERLPPERTGVTFVNRLPDDTAFNILNYLYFYDDGGVARGGITTDRLPHLPFTAHARSKPL